jgi:hypothetical protein
MRRFLAAACIALLAPGCGPGTPPDGDEDDGGTRSGLERWKVKTGHDDHADDVNLFPRAATIAALRAIAPPSTLDPDSTRFTYAGSPETQSYRLTNVTLAGYKEESDGDYHLVVEDAAGDHMIAEIADPVRLAERWKAPGANVRHAFDARHAPDSTFQFPRETVTVTGIGFFDLLHGQTGAAPNGIEIHPVLGICWGRDCASTQSTTSLPVPGSTCAPENSAPRCW